MEIFNTSCVQPWVRTSNARVIKYIKGIDNRCEIAVCENLLGKTTSGAPVRFRRGGVFHKRCALHSTFAKILNADNKNRFASFE